MSVKKPNQTSATDLGAPGQPAIANGLHWEEDERPARRTFPGPKGAAATLRVAIGKDAYADIVKHAGESLDKEVCGVLAGLVCEDDNGLFVQAEASIRGTMARQAGTQVTFTQETWNHLHDVMSTTYPKLKIVGWYHTHPGHGVIFSDMDLFIHRHFFSSPTHVALVTDPLAGTVAACVNAPGGIRNLEKLWVDGRELRLQVPESAADDQEEALEPQSGPARLQSALKQTRDKLETLETRMSHLVEAVDAERADNRRIITVLAAFALLVFVGIAAHAIYRGIAYKYEPPEVRQYVPVPVKLGDNTVYLGVAVVDWKISDELNAAHVQAEKELLAAKVLAETAAAARTSAPAPWWKRVLIWLHLASPPATPASASGTEKTKEGKSHELAK